MRKSAPLLITLLISFVLTCLFLRQEVPTKDDLLNSGCNVFMPGRMGTANFINNYGHPYLITCKHVVGTNIDVDLAKEYFDNKVSFSKGKVVIISESQDFVIIELTGKLFINTKIVKYSVESPKLGENIFYFGLISRPGKLFFTNGYVAQFNLPTNKPNENLDSMYSVTIPGSSGSTIFNKDGLGIGIICRSNSEDGRSHSFYLPASVIREKLAEKGLASILDGGYNRSVLAQDKLIKVP